jgi:hypothetical protein
LVSSPTRFLELLHKISVNQEIDPWIDRLCWEVTDLAVFEYPFLVTNLPIAEKVIDILSLDTENLEATHPRTHKPFDPDVVKAWVDDLKKRNKKSLRESLNLWPFIHDLEDVQINHDLKTGALSIILLNETEKVRMEFVFDTQSWVDAMKTRDAGEWLAEDLVGEFVTIKCWHEKDENAEVVSRVHSKVGKYAESMIWMMVKDWADKQPKTSSGELRVIAGVRRGPSIQPRADHKRPPVKKEKEKKEKGQDKILSTEMLNRREVIVCDFATIEGWADKQEWEKKLIKNTLTDLAVAMTDHLIKNNRLSSDSKSFEGTELWESHTLQVKGLHKYRALTITHPLFPNKHFLVGVLERETLNKKALTKQHADRMVEQFDRYIAQRIAEDAAREQEKPKDDW